MAATTKIFRNFYRDSVSLMQLSARLTKLPGIVQASAIMATEANLALLREAKLLRGATDAGPNDLLIALEGRDRTALNDAISEAEAVFGEQPGASGGIPRQALRSLEMGLNENPGANLALVSTPGEYATAEALKALRLGLNVMLFSDNVPAANEVMLKRVAHDRGLIVMGPDCGTAIIGGIPLGFANVVNHGSVGVVAASGTGLQQVTCIVDRLGGGISQAIGTGSRDVSREVGGIAMLQGLQSLAADPATKVVVLVSKPPATEVAMKILATARGIKKPVVVNFLGADSTTIADSNLHPAKTLEDAAYAAIALLRGKTPKRAPQAKISNLPRLRLTQKYVRGLYSGGTFCYEASLLLGERLPTVFTSTPVGRAKVLDNVWCSQENTVIDLGDDLFTRGRPHPMIDHRLRSERIATEAADPETAVIVLDVVLGFGSHMNPACEVAAAIEKAQLRAAKARRKIVFVGFLCGTERDPQGFADQERILHEAGMMLMPSNAQAVRLAARIVGGAKS